MISLRKLPLFIFVVYSWQCSDHYVITLGTLWSGELGTKRSDNTTTMRISRSLMGEMDIGTHQQDRNGSFRKDKLMRSVYDNNYHGGGYLGRHHPYYDNSMDSLITNSSMDSTSMGSCSSLFTGNSTFTDSSMDSLTDRSMDSITDNSMESPFDRSMESLFPQMRDFHGDYEDTITTDTYSQKGGYVDKHNYNFGEDFYHVMYKNNGYEKTKAKAKTGIHLPMLDEYSIEEHEYYNNSKNGRKINSVNQKKYRNISSIRKFFNKIDAKLESEIRRYLDMKEGGKHCYPIRKVNGARKFFNILSKYRVPVLLGVLGIVLSIFFPFLLITGFSGISSLLPFAAALPVSTGPLISKVLFPIYYLLLSMFVTLILVGYDLLVLYYVHKLDKMERSRKYIKNLIAMRNKDDE
ncbi:Plasmodium exported protein, unknown function [Plasmodium knowlesi strain H]|uniref:Pv-fam-d protein n=3 Tax=Plasmodium knowlesi TaxID=5850 RepID=A0A5K1UTS2_PLAKH|nr:uncharacterized protein PKNH_0800300 [Plasmodium knowlesi strain H]OTN66008.1 Uncharacterized protein PKNOH_S100028000 [Plasmodium knowlesi]CAA9987647.1 Plasmodium exported protein, unknown function [Plasmodium knowlesi strain H]SBO27192.1 Plasmodium exported protein, unknown function [Plasmodium knowlesi strain H]SBO29675.1 Plasmodium exported protein, unknown function [Plasmodium knowlesi strain H]VVS77121.1 Plasmodium exported protein, unknown function [Plasmodium knowlesi strain H]|eukprot:XP_002258645.1 [Plasmodium knowlesi strain H]